MDKHDLSVRSFESRAASALKQLWTDREFTDVTLVTEDYREIRAHRSILASFSRFFKDVFLNISQKDIVLYLKGVNFVHLRLILDFIYLGQCKIAGEDLDSFLAAGKDLKVDGLEEYVNSHQIKDYQVDYQLLQPDLFEANDQESKEIITVEKKETIWDYSNKNDTGENNLGEKLDEVKTSNEIGSILDVQPAVRNSNGKFSCDQCGGEFTNQTGLRRHMMSKHMGVRFRCDHCDFKSPRQSSLKSHKLSKHTTERFQCNNCEFQFYFQTDLNKHISNRHQDLGR
jgi:predicted RNA-binding Zn-ribbon protein involved in translation (DUF1610 family)